MEKVRLGKTGLMVSRIGFGGIPIQRLSEPDAVAVVERCLNLDITFFDSANNYTTSEGRIGKTIKGKRRQDLILATKSAARKRELVEQQLANSLKVLGTDYIDLYQFHNVNDTDNLEMILAPNGPMSFVEQQMKEGVIRHVGITCHQMDAAKTCVKTNRFETLMFPFNFITKEPAEELLPLIRERDMGFIAMKPLAGGMLNNPTLAFKYLLQFPDVVPIVGIEKPSEIEEIVGVLNKSVRLTSTERRDMDRMVKELGTRFCRRCEYCQPCSANIEISTVIHSPAFAKRMPLASVFNERLTQVMQKTYDCLDCGDCEQRCPFKLPIRQLLKERREWFSKAKAEYENSKGI